ncbi:hypothetical protein E4U17_001758, partial [Claviceps sp. LM77 group G4]
SASAYYYCLPANHPADAQYDTIRYDALRNRTDFPDSMTVEWDATRIANLLCSAFAPQVSPQRVSDAGSKPTANIDVLITFDAHGVSSHPNHMSLYHGARLFLSILMRGKAEWPCPVDLYTLTSVPMVRKYSGFLDVFATMVVWVSGSRHRDGPHPGGLLFMNQLLGGQGLPRAWGAMTRAHKSQMVWFRYFWILLSRYMLMNDLKLEEVA